jgi:UDP-glucose:(heptosyl)LPS alpha-1,3-glucosyltransferase
MKKVNIFVKYFHNKGGGERVCFNFVSYLLEQGVDVRVICGENRLHDDKMKDIITETGLLKPSRYLKYTSFHKRAQKLIKGLDGVHFSFDRIPGCHIYRNGSGLHSSYVTKTLELLPKNKAFKKSIARAINPVNKHLIAMEEKTYKHPDLKRVILNSQFLKREVLSAFPEAESIIQVIPNGVDKLRYSFVSDRPFRTLYSINDEKRVIGFAANNFQRKGLDHLIGAMGLLGGEFSLLVAGDRSSEGYKSHIKDLGLSDRITFIGGVDNMQGFYASCDVICMPSLYDSFGNVIPESLMCGTPVVVSAMAGSSEIVKDGENGYVVESLDKETVADAIRKCALLGRKDYSRHVMSEEEMYGRYLDVISEVAGEG